MNKFKKQMSEERELIEIACAAIACACIACVVAIGAVYAVIAIW